MFPSHTPFNPLHTHHQRRPVRHRWANPLSIAQLGGVRAGLAFARGLEEGQIKKVLDELPHLCSLSSTTPAGHRKSERSGDVELYTYCG